MSARLLNEKATAENTAEDMRRAVIFAPVSVFACFFPKKGVHCTCVKPLGS